MSEHAIERLWEQFHRLESRLHGVQREQEEIIKLMSQITDFTTSVQTNLDAISTDLDNIARQIAAGGDNLSAADVAALATFKANIAAVQAKADAMVKPAGTVPTITTQPVSQTVAAGQTATFSVVAADDVPLTYQWLHDGTPVGTNSPVLSIPNVTTTDAGEYMVVCSNPNGSAVSSNALLTVA